MELALFKGNGSVHSNLKIKVENMVVRNLNNNMVVRNQ